MNRHQQNNPGRPQSAKESLETNSLSAVEHILSHRPDRLKRISVSATVEQKNTRIAAICAQAKQAGVQVDRSSTGGESIKATISPFEYSNLKDMIEKLADKPRAVLIALDHLQDPQNFGALARTAEALGADGILIPKDRGVTVTSGVYNASVGAVETLPIVMVTNIGEAIRKLKDERFWIVGTAIGKDAKPPWEAPDFERVVIVLGTELEGISPGIEKLCDWQVEIPLKGMVQSLNVSVAGALLMYHFCGTGRPSEKTANNPASS